MSQTLPGRLTCGNLSFVVLNFATKCGITCSMDAKQFARAVGRAEMARALDVGTSAVRNAVVRGWFPSSWFLVAREIATEKGVDCPPDLFGMKPPARLSSGASQ